MPSSSCFTHTRRSPNPSSPPHPSPSLPPLVCIPLSSPPPPTWRTWIESACSDCRHLWRFDVEPRRKTLLFMAVMVLEPASLRWWVVEVQGTGNSLHVVSPFSSLPFKRVCHGTVVFWKHSLDALLYFSQVKSFATHPPTLCDLFMYVSVRGWISYGSNGIFMLSYVCITKSVRLNR